MSRWGMLADLERCVGCQTCTAACRHANATSPAVQWRKVLDVETGAFPDVSRTFVPVGCQHCADPPCVHVCPTTATRQRPDGIVTIDYELCIGCAYCEVACPYQARFLVHEPRYAYAAGAMRNETERQDDARLGVAQKCTFCIDRIDFGLERGLTPGLDPRATPACVNACIADALHFGDLDDPNSNVSRLLGEQKHFRMHEELGTAPNFFYLYGKVDDPNSQADDPVPSPSAAVGEGNRARQGATSSSPRLPSGRLRPSSTGYGEGRGEGASPQAQTRGKAPSSAPTHPSPVYGGGMGRGDLSPQAGRGEGPRLRTKGVEPWHQPHWDWKAAANFLYGGAGAGLFAFAATASLHGAPAWPVELFALALIGTGLALLMFKIGRPLRFIYVLLQPRRSWMTREAWVAAGFFPAALAALWSDNSLLTMIAAALGLVFLFCQAMILKAAKGVPIWRAHNIVPLMISTGLAEGGGLFLCTAAALPQLGPSLFPAAAFVAMLAAARAWEWHCYFVHLRKNGAPARSIEILGVCRGWFMALGFIAPVTLIALGFVLTGGSDVLFAVAGIMVFAAGWALKFIMITRAAYNQGFALNHTPVRGSGLPGGAVKPGWA
jgi:phenylacetyl-CoA:acceptor oxidoreductase subunit 1